MLYNLNRIDPIFVCHFVQHPSVCRTVEIDLKTSGTEQGIYLGCYLHSRVIINVHKLSKLCQANVV
jgi:hypothetical protein